MRTVDRTRPPLRARPRRVRIVQPAPRPPSVRRASCDPPAPTAPCRRAAEPSSPAMPPAAAAVDGKVRHLAAGPRATPEDATLRALFRVAAAAVARRGEPKP